LAIKDSETNFLIEGNGFSQTYLTSNGAIVLNPGYGGIEMVGSYRTFKATDITADGFVSGEIRATNNVVSSSTQITELAPLMAYTASLKGAIEVSGQNVNVLGMITAQQFNVTYVSSSVMYQSGSNKFGDSSDDRHQFTGSLNVSGGLVDIAKDGQSLRIWAQNSANSSRIQLQSSGSNGLLGANSIIAIEGKTGGDNFTNSTPFSLAIGTATQKALHLGTNSNVVMTITGSTSTFTGDTIAPSFYTTKTTQSIPFTTWTTVFDMNGNAGIFLFSVQLDGQVADEWAASGIVMSTGVSSGVTAQYIGTQNDGTYVQTRISGTTFQVFQNGTSPNVNMNVRIFRIG
jgi:hypothetical protein